MKIGIFGSRSLRSKKNYKFIEKKIKEFCERNKVDFILLPGDIKGVCSSALKIASKIMIPTTLYFYDKSSSGKWNMINSIKERTLEIIDKADYFLIFHDGESKGTLWDLERVIRARKHYKYFKVKKEEDLENMFNIEEYMLDFDKGDL